MARLLYRHDLSPALPPHERPVHIATITSDIIIFLRNCSFLYRRGRQYVLLSMEATNYSLLRHPCQYSIDTYWKSRKGKGTSYNPVTSFTSEGRFHRTYEGVTTQLNSRLTTGLLFYLTSKDIAMRTLNMRSESWLRLYSGW